MCKNMTAAIVKNIWGRQGISYLSKHLSHVKMEPPSCFSCKIYILWVVPFLQNRLIWIGIGTNWSCGCSVCELTDRQPIKLLLRQLCKTVPFHPIAVGLPAVGGVVSNLCVHCLCTSGTFLNFLCHSRIK